MLQGTGSFELKMTKLYFSFQKILFVWFISESNTAEYLTKNKTKNPSLVKAGLNLEKKENLSFCVFTDVSLEI